jgi:hypothetical protein
METMHVVGPPNGSPSPIFFMQQHKVPGQKYIQGGALNRGLLFADPPPSLLGAVSGNISEIR